MQLVKYLIKNYGSWNFFYIKYYGLSDLKLLCERIALIVSGRLFKCLQIYRQYVHFLNLPRSSTSLKTSLKAAQNTWLELNGMHLYS